MDRYKIEQGMLLAQEGMLLNKIDIQMLLQLLVEKGIITREEVAIKREYVSNQPRYKTILYEIDKLQRENDENQYFTQEFEKYLKSNSKCDDINFIKRYLDDLK